MSKVILSRYPFRSSTGRVYKVIVKEQEVAEGEKCFQVELHLPITRQEKGAFGRAKTKEGFLMVYLNTYPIHGIASHVEMVYKFVNEYESKPHLVEDPFYRRLKAMEELETAFGEEEENEMRLAEEPQAAMR